MSARRFFVEGVRAAGETVTITGGDAHKIAHVLRLHAGDGLEIVDSTGTLFETTLDAIGETSVRATLQSASAAPETGLEIDVAQAVPKGQKMDFVVEKVTELGAHAILPFYSERTIVHDPGTSKRERWHRLAAAAARQCGRRSIPAVQAPCAFDELLERFGEYDTVLMPWELAAQVPVLQTLAQTLSGKRRILVVIGPEGGFSHREADAAGERGASLLWLGTRILRTETAAMALLAVIDAWEAAP
ncbi:MAG: 16S rRNA (uracil(1498)-N(3))-methyltransferase [Candidatus Eremiobacteraeota bacterium]|nr:16S rRNA (uracil(1498)-N(3))-methyltransferase [Candidatus Eremiobacteraeota bacterium]